jgi:hypothetical protein
MNPDDAKRGVLLQMENGSLAEVLEPSTDGSTVKVRYVESEFEPELLDQEDTINLDDVLTHYADRGVGRIASDL